jgi:hypothetical protein
VTEESKGSKAVPGSGAGDAAPTQAIPRIPKPPAASSASGKTAPAKSAPAKPAAAASAPAKPGAATSAPAKKAAASTPPATATAKTDQTDKGRPRKAAPPAPAKPEPKRQIQPVGGPTGRPLTAADYEATTKGSPASTSVIPAVKDRPADPKPSTPAATVQPGPGRRASLRLTHVEPWSVTRLAFAISVAMMIVAVVAVAIFWYVLDFVGVWDQINDSFTTVLSDDTSAFNVTDYFGVGRVIGLTLVLSAVNVVLMTALATIAAHLYNLAAQLMGGVEVTLAEDK